MPEDWTPKVKRSNHWGKKPKPKKVKPDIEFEEKPSPEQD